jgi:hypothetical protein
MQVTAINFLHHPDLVGFLLIHHFNSLSYEKTPTKIGFSCDIIDIKQ